VPIGGPAPHAPTPSVPVGADDVPSRTRLGPPRSLKSLWGERPANTLVRSVQRTSAPRSTASPSCLAVVALFTVLAVCAACGGTSSAGSSRGPTPSIAPESSARAGALPFVTGRSPTRGPIGLDPSKTGNGVQLDALDSLRDDTPVFNGDFADPFALRTADVLYIYSSDTVTTRYAPGAHIPVISLARDSGFEGHYLGDAMPSLPKWTVSGYQWAPSVWARPDGSYVMYYSTPATVSLGCLARTPPLGCIKTVNGTTSAMCISRAVSSSPAGPFVDDSSSAFICPLSNGGAIDPSVFVAPDGTPWLLWKSDGDCCNLPTTIYSQQLSADGLSTVGPAHALIGATQSWEGHLVEAPSMIENGNTYWLFYSANLWGSDNYGIGVARCTSVIGPCTKPLDHAWLSSDGSGLQRDPGPGGQEFFQAGGLIWMVHHGLAAGESGNNAQRRLYVDLLSFPPGQPPRIAPRIPSAAIAEAVLYYGDPNLPPQPRQAFLSVIHEVPDTFPSASSSGLVAAGMAACGALGHFEGADAVISSLEHRQLSEFQSDLVAISAAEYLCPQDALEALRDSREALNQSS